MTMKLLYLTLLVCVLTSLVNAIDVRSFQIQDAANEQTTDSTTHCSVNPSYHFPTTKSIRLLSSDNAEFVVQKELAERSVLIRNLLEDVNEIDPVIPLSNITAKALRKVIEWCDHHSSDLVVTDETERHTTEIDEWDKAFLQVDQETLFDILLAANYLDIKGLVDVCCKTVADMIKGKTAKEIQTIFKVSNDFTPEEEAQIRKENEWVEDPTIAAAVPNL